MEQYQIHKATLASDYAFALKLIELRINLDELDAISVILLYIGLYSGEILTL